MKPMKVKQICNLVNGQLIQGTDDLVINDIFHIPKKLKSNGLLFVRQKWRLDWEIISQSTPCAIVTDSELPELKRIKNCTVLKVQDIERAFWRFVNFYRNQFSIPVVAVTGTCGKTTTKDMIKHILSFDQKVTGTNKSANSRTHHLTYLLSIEKDTDAAVFETAVGAPGDVSLAARYYQPTIGIITNIGVYHLDGCKTPEAYFQAKAEMVRAVKPTGTLILNADDEKIKKLDLQTFKGKVLTFGVENPADFQATNIQYGNNGMNFELVVRDKKLRHLKQQFSAFVPGYGYHQVLNALAAFVAVHEMSIPLNEAVQRLQSFKNLPLHLQRIELDDGCIVLDDTWNSNPTSFEAAFQVLNGIARGKKRVALVSGIGKLDDFSIDVHRQVGEMIAENGVDVLITVGSRAVEIAKQAKSKGLNGKIYTFPDVNGVEKLLKKTLDGNSILLVKCSPRHNVMNLKRKLLRRRVR